MYQKPKIQSTAFKNLSKLKCLREDASVPLGRKKKAFTSGDRGKDLGGKVDWSRVGWEWGLGRGKTDLVLGEGK
jgi:hypothetical protein